jgi:hypothetical protein
MPGSEPKPFGAGQSGPMVPKIMFDELWDRMSDAAKANMTTFPIKELARQWFDIGRAGRGRCVEPTKGDK